MYDMNNNPCTKCPDCLGIEEAGVHCNYKVQFVRFDNEHFTHALENCEKGKLNGRD